MNKSTLPDKIKEELTQIIRDNITFSGQVGDYIIHGAIEKIQQKIDQEKRSTAIAFSEWIAYFYEIVGGGKGEDLIWEHVDSSRKYKTAELYDLYINSL